MYNNLRAIRIERGLTQKQVATDLAISIQRYNNYETGKREPDNKMLCILAVYFKCTTDYLLGLSNDPNQRIENAPMRDGTEAYVQIDEDSDELTSGQVDQIRQIVEEYSKDL